VVWNLCINALEAMTTGTLTIKLKEVSAYHNHHFHANRRGVVLEVVDQVCGIAPDQMEIFMIRFIPVKKMGLVSV